MPTVHAVDFMQIVIWVSYISRQLHYLSRIVYDIIQSNWLSCQSFKLWCRWRNFDLFRKFTLWKSILKYLFRIWSFLWEGICFSKMHDWFWLRNLFFKGAWLVLIKLYIQKCAKSLWYLNGIFNNSIICRFMKIIVIH